MDEFVEECNREIERLTKLVEEGKIRVYEDKMLVVTPDQLVPHQFGYCSSVEPMGNRDRRYQR